MGIGWTIGEEILYGTSTTASIERHENCHSVNDSCLLQITVDDLAAMSKLKEDTGDGGAAAALTEDYEILIGFLEKNYDVKNGWRKK